LTTSSQNAFVGSQQQTIQNNCGSFLSQNQNSGCSDVQNANGKLMNLKSHVPRQLLPSFGLKRAAGNGDPQKVEEYAASIEAHMKLTEGIFQAYSGYLSQQADINESMR
jgi:hypothetical protein